MEIESGKEVAVKVEELTSSAPRLAFEYAVSQKLVESNQGFAVPCTFYAKTGSHCALVMPLLGQSIESMMRKCGGKLSVKTTLMIAEQLIRRLEYLHAQGIVHRDIKPENFIFGCGSTEHHVHLIDFGLSKVYHDGNRHVRFSASSGLTGTARYASINAHKGYRQSRRDDLEAAGYMLMYMLNGVLPWSSVADKGPSFLKIAEKKMNANLDELCQGHPQCFKAFLEKVRALEYDECPDYTSYRKAFREVFDAAGYVEDYDYDWYEGTVPSDLAPIGPWVSPPQPGDGKPKLTLLVSGAASEKADEHRTLKSTVGGFLCRLLVRRQCF
jgi:serine/threonine protein kinase